MGKGRKGGFEFAFRAGSDDLDWHPDAARSRLPRTANSGLLVIARIPEYANDRG
jgi:hypothetical protein